MPGCRKLDTAPSPSPSRGPVQMARYVRLRARPPRAANDNRRAASGRFWPWAAMIAAVPAIGLAAALSHLI